eukprot:TRINITY_DN6361_c0_g1_i3.p1 TRINITY_DN6361_c0_g1~~TRINITY_DN6361_c0_g1_i3.p1  ORF type:complete len:979 (+),score=338.26 TRINITY_DN6361_c0_g1_i3:70-2937(+)
MNSSLIELDELRSKHADTVSNVSGDDDDITQTIPREISAKQLMVHLSGDIQRTRNYKTMPFYLVFLSTFTAMLIAVNMAHYTLNPEYYFNQSAKEVMGYDQMIGLNDRSDVWDWLDAATANVWLRTPKGRSECSAAFDYRSQSTIDPARSARSALVAPAGLTLDGCCGECFNTPDCVGWVYDNRTAECTMYEGVALMYNPDPDIMTGVPRGNGWYTFFPITLFVVRQWRVPQKECDLNDQKFRVVPTADRYNIDGMSGCVNHYDTGMATTESYGENQQFVSERTAQRLGGPPPLGSGTYSSTTTSRVYDLGEAFAISFPFSYNYDTVRQELQLLRDEHWIDGQTRALAVDTIFFDPELNSFVHFKGTIEIFVTGAMLMSARSTPFTIWSFATPVGGILFAVDCIIVVCVVSLAVETFKTRRRFRKIAWITDNGPPVWEVFEVANFITFFLTYYARAQMWKEGYGLFQSGHVEDGVRALGNCTAFCEERVQFTALAMYSAQSYQSASWFAPSIILAYLRLFKFLQHNVRMNALSETVKEARGDFLGMSLIFMIVCVGYAVAGTLLFAHEFEAFQTFFSTTSYLVRLIFTGDMGLWDDMTRVSHPVIVAAYLLSWFVICWLVLLNMILAVIAGAFSVVQENTQARHSSNRSIVEDVKTYVLKYVFSVPQIHETAKPETKKPIWWYKCLGMSTGGDPLRKLTFSRGWCNKYITRRLNSLIAIREYYEQKKKHIGTKVEWDRVFLTERVLLKIMRWARNNGDEVLNNYEATAAFNDAMEQTMGDQIALRVGERSIERMMSKMDEFQRKLEVSSSQVMRLQYVAEQQGLAINNITMQSSQTAKTVDRMGAHVKQAVVTVTESAEAVNAVASQQGELLTTTQDIAAAVETQHQVLSPAPLAYKRSLRRRGTDMLQSTGSMSSIVLSPTDPGIKDLSVSKSAAPESARTEGQQTSGAYSWDC